MFSVFDDQKNRNQALYILEPSRRDRIFAGQTMAAIAIYGLG